MKNSCNIRTNVHKEEHNGATCTSFRSVPKCSASFQQKMPTKKNLMKLHIAYACNEKLKISCFFFCCFQLRSVVLFVANSPHMCTVKTIKIDFSFISFVYDADDDDDILHRMR